MKHLNILLITGICLGSPVKGQNNSDKAKVSLEFRITAPLDNKKNIPFKLCIKNESNIGVKLSDPRCWVNTIPYIINRIGDTLPVIKIRVKVDCLKEFIVLPPKSCYEVNYNYSLSFLCPTILNEGFYKVYFVYNGHIEDENGNIVEFKTGLFSNCIEFDN